jgi:hypothetical protein
VGFEAVTFSCTVSIWPQTPETHQETSDVGTWSVSVVGNWLSKDPIGISGGLNQYVFCGDNPVNFVDPLGLDHLDDVIKEFSRMTPAERRRGGLNCHKFTWVALAEATIQTIKDVYDEANQCWLKKNYTRVKEPDLGDLNRYDIVVRKRDGVIVHSAVATGVKGETVGINNNIDAQGKGILPRGALTGGIPGRNLAQGKGIAVEVYRPNVIPDNRLEEQK